MKTTVVGLGVQGCKRRENAGPDLVSTVDPVNSEAQYRSIQEVPLESYDAALICTPDEANFEIIKYCLSHSKHVLVEKPLWVPEERELLELEGIALIIESW